MGFPVYCKDDVLFRLEGTKREIGCLVGFGAQNARISMLNKLRQAGVGIPSAVHSKAVISPSAEIEDGVFIGPLAIVGPRVKIKFGSIINDSAIIGHDSIVEEFAQIAPNVSIGGRCRIKNSAFIGIGTTVLPDKIIGESSMVGAGSVVTHHIDANDLVYGVPATSRKKI